MYDLEIYQLSKSKVARHNEVQKILWWHNNLTQTPITNYSFTGSWSTQWSCSRFSRIVYFSTLNPTSNISTNYSFLLHIVTLVFVRLMKDQNQFCYMNFLPDMAQFPFHWSNKIRKYSISISFLLCFEIWIFVHFLLLFLQIIKSFDYQTNHEVATKILWNQRNP